MTSDLLQSVLTGARWTPSPTEFLPHYTARVLTANLRMSGMPPSPASKRATWRSHVTYTTRDRSPRIVGHIKHEPTDVGLRLMRELPLDQMNHRSRVETTMSNHTQANEFRRRLMKTKDPTTKEALTPYVMPSDTSKRFADQELQVLKRHLRFEPHHIAHYITEHKNSSVSPGVKWATLPDPLTSEGCAWWKFTFELVRDLVDQWIEHPEYYPAFPLNMGGRARSEQLTQPDVWDYEFASERSRVIMFHPALSMMFAFVPDKTSYYKEIWVWACAYVDAPDYLMFPPVDGGKVYSALRDALIDEDDLIVILGDDFTFVKDGEFKAWDGSNWEQFVSRIMGKHHNWGFTSFGGESTLPSGVHNTSLKGSLAMLWTGLGVMRSGVEEVPGVFERQPEDEARKFMLGLRYKDDPAHPRLQGLKLCVDNAKSTVPFKADMITSVKSHYSIDQSLSWYNAYHGLTLDGSSLLDTFDRIEGKDYVNPGRLVQDVVLGV